MASQTTALTISAVIGTGYAANVLLMTDTYLKDQGQKLSPESRYMARGIAGGVIGLTVISALARSGGAELQNAACMANFGSFISWGIAAAHKNLVEGTTHKGPKVDMAICGTMLALFVSAVALAK